MYNINYFGEQHWYVVTLVDITETGVFREKGKRRNQQRNFRHTFTNNKYVFTAYLYAS